MEAEKDPRLEIEEYLQRLKSTSEENVNETFDVLESSMIDKERFARYLSISDQIYSWLAKVIIPRDITIAATDLEDPDTIKEVPGLAVSQHQALRGLKVLQLLDSIAPFIGSKELSGVLIGLAAQSDSRDFWNTEAAAGVANTLLQKYSNFPKLPEIIVDRVLRDFLKPIFARSRNAAVTIQGRKAVRPMPPQYSSIQWQIETKSWKYGLFYTCTVYKWTLSSFNSEQIKEHWPLIIPPLLSILDDESTFFKAKGCELLRILLAQTEPVLLLRTGLGNVMTDAIKPCLSYLPSLTPPEESVRLLQQAFPALLQLSGLLYPGERKKREKMLFLDDVLINGVLKGLDHTANGAHGPESPAVMSLLLQQIPIIVEQMGIWSVRHLQSFIPFLVDLLCNPFSNADPRYAKNLLGSLDAFIVNGWPKINAFQIIILEGVISLGMRLKYDSSSNDQKILIPILGEIVSDLQASIPPGRDWDHEVAPLLNVDPILKGLLTRS